MNPPIAEIYGKLKNVGAPAPKDNPFVRSIEVLTSHDRTLLEQPEDSCLTFNKSPSDPTTILISAKLEALEEKSLCPVEASLVTRQDILSKYQSYYNESESSKRMAIRQTILLHPPQFLRAPFDSLSPGMAKFHILVLFTNLIPSRVIRYDAPYGSQGIV